MTDDKNFIRKSDAIKAFREEWERIMPRSDRYMIKRSFMVNAIKTIPPADVVEPKRGEWKRRIVDGGWNANLVCSECGYTLMIEDGYNFCPNCGADMRKGADDE